MVCGKHDEISSSKMQGTISWIQCWHKQYVEHVPLPIIYLQLNGIEIKYVDSEKDLGVIITTKLNWEENILALCLKASSWLGLMRRTLHFIKAQKQKKGLLSGTN